MPVRSIARAAWILAGASVAAVTLMACYGMPPCGAQLPDGGVNGRSYGCVDESADGGSDGGVTDGGTDAGP